MPKLLLIFVAGLFSFILLNLLFPVQVHVNYSTVITDSKGEIVHAFLTPDDKWRMQTTLSEISPLLRNTIIEKEDKLFYHHAGVNPFALMRAVIKNVLHLKRTSGASTITMQVARALEPKRRTYFNKIIEVCRAWQLEWKFSKDEILQLYCNLLPYGSNIEGMKAASLLYFKKDPDHLSLAEITALCVIPNRPSSLVPGRNNQAILAARNIWLTRFAAENIFPEKDIRDALSEPFDVSRQELPRMIPQLAYSLKNSSSAPVVHSTIDMHMQQQTETIVKDYSRNLKLSSINNAAVVIIDNYTHSVLSYVPSADFTDTANAGEVDGASAIRQPGSTLKPLLYAMCIDGGLLTPKSMISDVAVNYDGYAPENFNKQFNGYVSMEHALEHSLNVPAVKSLKQLGKDKMISALASCNFSQIRKDRKKLGLSMILGGCGASLVQLTGLYSAFANGGIYTKPSFTTDHSSTHKFQVVSQAAAFMINETLSKINRPDFPVNWQSTSHMPKIAWKTGTSYGRRDAWSIGYNKRYTIGVWVGNFSGAGVQGLTGSESATPLLFRIFNTIDYDPDDDWFTQPSDCDSRLVCSETGMCPSSNCQHLVSDYFIPMVSSSAICNNFQEIMISADEKMSYCKTCMPVAGYKKKLFRIVPAEMQAFYDERAITYQKIPPHNPDCEKVFRDGQPLIISPRPGADYLISRKYPQPLQLLCRPGNDVTKVYWYVNDKFYKTTSATGNGQYFVPDEGRVKISCTDDKGRNRDVWINVKYVDL